MQTFLVLLGLIAYAAAVPIAQSKQDFSQFLPALFPNLFPAQQEISNPILNQIKPFLVPVSDLVQPLINPVLKPINDDTSKIPIVGNIVKDCTDNSLLCILSSLDTAIANRK